MINNTHIALLSAATLAADCLMQSIAPIDENTPITLGKRIGRTAIGALYGFGIYYISKRANPFYIFGLATTISFTPIILNLISPLIKDLANGDAFSRQVLHSVLGIGSIKLLLTAFKTSSFSLALISISLQFSLFYVMTRTKINPYELIPALPRAAIAAVPARPPTGTLAQYVERADPIVGVAGVMSRLEADAAPIEERQALAFTFLQRTLQTALDRLEQAPYAVPLAAWYQNTQTRTPEVLRDLRYKSQHFEPTHIRAVLQDAHAKNLLTEGNLNVLLEGPLPLLTFSYNERIIPYAREVFSALGANRIAEIVDVAAAEMPSLTDSPFNQGSLQFTLAYQTAIRTLNQVIVTCTNPPLREHWEPYAVNNPEIRQEWEAFQQALRGHLATAARRKTDLILHIYDRYMSAFEAYKKHFSSFSLWDSIVQTDAGFNIEYGQPKKLILLQTDSPRFVEQFHPFLTKALGISLMLTNLKMDYLQIATPFPDFTTRQLLLDVFPEESARDLNAQLTRLSEERKQVLLETLGRNGARIAFRSAWPVTFILTRVLHLSTRVTGAGSAEEKLLIYKELEQMEQYLNALKALLPQTAEGTVDTVRAVEFVTPLEADVTAEDLTTTINLISEQLTEVLRLMEIVTEEGLAALRSNYR